MSSSDVFTPSGCASAPPRDDVIDYLRRQMETISARRSPHRCEGISTGIPEVDALLPPRKVSRGCCVEWIADGEGTGAETLSVKMAWHATTGTRLLVIVDPSGEIYPPGLAYLGVDLERVVFLHPSSERDAFWAIIQILRCPAVGAVWARLTHLDMKTGRRFQLAAEQGQTLGVFVRPLRTLQEISWAEVRFLVEPQPLRFAGESSQRRRVKVTVLRAKGQWEQISGEVEIDDPADPLSQSSEGPVRIDGRRRAVGALRA